MRTLLALLAVLAASPAWAVPAVVYDQDGKVSAYGDVEGTHAAPANSIVIDSPNDSHTDQQKQTYSANKAAFHDLRNRRIPIRHWKVEVGLLKEMSQSEKDVVDAPIIAARQQRMADAVELATLRQEVDDAYANWDSLTTDKAAATKKLIRLNQLERKLNGT